MSGRFDKQPEGTSASWMEADGVAAGKIRIRSCAHLARVMYASGWFGKSELFEFWIESAAKHQHQIREIAAGRGKPGESITQLSSELGQIREALEEVNGLPEDWEREP